MGKNESTLKTKISPLIEGQSPSFVQADHPTFIKFVRDYYKFLEAGELTLTGTINNIIQETDTTGYILAETGDRMVDESSTIVFSSGETITGGTSKATATVLVSDVGAGTKRLFISAQQKFKTGETITGGTSSSTATIARYRGNPVQNIQQLLEYADSDNTIYDFLDNMRDSFMSSIPYNLDDGVDKRKLIQNIKQLYKAKGTTRGHQLLMRLLFDEDSEVNYPNEKMLRASDSGWLVKDVMRVIISSDVDGNEFKGQKITGVESEATSIVETTQTLVEGGVTFTEIDLDNDQTVGTFILGEQVTAISNLTDLTIRATIKSIVIGGTVSDRGSYYLDDQTINIPTGSSAGNGSATAAIDAISSGEVDGFIVDDAGTGYVVGDALVFNNTGAGGSGVAAKVGVVGGGFAPEVGTVAELKIKADDHIVLEPYTTVTDSTGGDKIVIETGTFANLSVSSESGEITDILITNPGNTYTLLPKVSSITSSAGASGKVRPFSNSIGQAQGIKITNYGLEYGADFQLVTESGTGTYDNTGYVLLEDDSGDILLFEDDDNILQVSSIEIETFNVITEDSNNIKIVNNTPAPELLFYRNAILKDVSGTWSADSALTSHNGTVVSYDSDRQLLTVKITSLMNIVDEDNTGDNILFEDEDTMIYEDEVQWGDNSSVTMSAVTSTIAHASYATGTTTVGHIATAVGISFNDKSKVSEDLIRIQDSYYYQDYSYEISVGHSLNEYRDALKKSTHPAGWQEFGRTSLATFISARIKIPAGVDVSGFEGDDTFTPELASTFETIFSVVFGRRLGTSTDGTVIRSEEGYVLLEDNSGDVILDADGDKIIQIRPNPQEESSTGVLFATASLSGDKERDVTLTSSYILKLPLIRTTTKASFGYGKPTLSEIPLSLFTYPPSMFTLQLEDGEALLNEDGDEVIFENGTPIGLNWAGKQIMAVSDNTDGHSRFMPFQVFGSVTIKSISTQCEFLLEDSYGDDINFIELEAGTGTSPPYLQLEDNTASTPKIPRAAFYTEYVNAKIPGHVTGGKFLNERYSNTNYTLDSSALKFDDNSA